MRNRNPGWLIRDRARELRREPTSAEYKLWPYLWRRALGHRFRRQEPIGAYIVDFVCLDHRLVVELDGDGHNLLRDAERDCALMQRGFRVLRFSNGDVFDHLDAVIDLIAYTLTLDPPPRAEEVSP